MKRKLTAICLATCLIIINIGMATAHTSKNSSVINEQNATYDFSDDYGIQWQMNFGSNRNYGARYEGPQPIGDCDNDGKNEFLIGGRDDVLRVMEWDEGKQTYVQTHALHCLFYPAASMAAAGFAIGDLTGDGKNEIAASWEATVYKWISGKYQIIGRNPWVFQNGGGNPDCYIGDCDNDGQNEFILSCCYWRSSVPEIVVFGWNELMLVKEAEWDDPGVDGTVYMAGVGDVDYDGENEIVCGSAFKVIVLDWNKASKEFEATIIESKTPSYENYPFACVLKDSDMDGKDEIHVGYYSPDITIFEWNGKEYEIKFQKHWPGEGVLIESLDVGDVDNDGIAEVCAGTDLIHILQWDGSTYVEEAVLPTFGDLAALNIGDCDNDGKNEIHAGSVNKRGSKYFMSWVYKYGYEPCSNVIDSQQYQITTTAIGNLLVTIERASLRTPLGGASVTAWNLDTKTWYDIQPKDKEAQPGDDEWGSYSRYQLPSGEYLLRVTLENYKIQETTITIKDGQDTHHTFSLQPKPLEDDTPVKRSISPLFLQILKKLIDNFPQLARLLQLPIFNKLLYILK